MKRLFQVTCMGKRSLGFERRRCKGDIYVIAETETEAANKALDKMKELNSNDFIIDSFVSEVKLIADEKQSNDCILIL